MRYVSLTAEEKQQMLEEIGISRVEELFRTIPDGLRLKNDLAIPEAIPESSLLKYFTKLGKKNASTQNFTYFLGAGAYHHFIPTIIDSVMSRSEFYTAYTPYQPEVSQGTLQAIFEYQSLICQLTGMDVANASLYDGASALAEAVLMARRITKRKRVAVATSLHPEYRRVLETYTANLDLHLDTLTMGKDGSLNLDQLKSTLTTDHAAAVIQSPNFFGVIEDIEQDSSLTQQKDILLIGVVTEPTSLGVLKPPGQIGVDIAVGEGQPLGLPLGFGGPYLGFFATRDCYKRQMPGRLVGQTLDNLGRRSFVLTLATREQHIRREKATSNICTNQGLCALIAAVFLSTLGRQGLRELAEQNLKLMHYLRQQLADFVVFSGPTFNELVLRCPENPHRLNRRLFTRGIIGGLPLEKYFPRRADQMLVCVTEQNSCRDIDQFIQIFQGAQPLR